MEITVTYNRVGMVAAWVTILLLSACATSVTTHHHLSRAKASSFKFLNSYKAALHDFEQGRLMEARAKIVAMDKDRDDYQKARHLLRYHIDPSRKKMLQFYLDRARAHEKKFEWSLAARDFGQAAYFSIKPKQWLRHQHRLEIKIRQRRFDLLRRELQYEDQQVLARAHAFVAPRGLRDDAILKRWQQMRWDAIDDRAQVHYRAANRQLREGFPELGFAYLQSMLRLAPGDGRAIRLMGALKKKIPSAINLTPIHGKKHGKREKSMARMSRLKVQSAKQIRRLMANKKWAQARRYALAWKRQGGQDADALLAIQSKQSQRLFNQGRQAVKEEHLPLAVTLWQQAVMLSPTNQEYRKALVWAQQMQERLQLLRSSRTGKTTDGAKR